MVGEHSETSVGQSILDCHQICASSMKMIYIAMKWNKMHENRKLVMQRCTGAYLTVGRVFALLFSVAVTVMHC